MMRWQLSRALARLSRRVNPSRDFVVSLHRRLEDAGYLAPTVRRTPVWKLCGAGVLALLLVFIGTGSYAYASDDVLPDHPLYPLRQTIERAELELAPIVTRTPKEKTQAKMLARRVKELQLVREKNLRVAPEKKNIILKTIRDQRAAVEQQSASSTEVPPLAETFGHRVKKVINRLRPRRAFESFKQVR